MVKSDSSMRMMLDHYPFRLVFVYVGLVIGQKVRVRNVEVSVLRGTATPGYFTIWNEIV